MRVNTTVMQCEKIIKPNIPNTRELEKGTRAPCQNMSCCILDAIIQNRILTHILTATSLPNSVKESDAKIFRQCIKMASEL